MKSWTEAELLAEIERAGFTRQDAQLRFAAVVGMPAKDFGTVENADTIIGGAWPTPMRGARRHQCETCNRYVSLAPSSQAAIAQRPRHVVCMACAMSGRAEKLTGEGKPDA